MSEEYVWLITGYVSHQVHASYISLTRNSRSANRGIGLETVKQLLQSPSNIIIAACRNPAKATELQELAKKAGGKAHLVELDVSDKESINKAAKEVSGVLGGKGIDYLVNNAGIVRVQTDFCGLYH